MRQAIRGMASQSTQRKQVLLCLLVLKEGRFCLQDYFVREYSLLATSIKYILIKNSLYWKDVQDINIRVISKNVYCSWPNFHFKMVIIV